ARFLGTSVGTFHDARPATRHDREACTCEQPTGLLGQSIERTVRLESRRPEHRNARRQEVQRSKPTKNFEEYAKGAEQVTAPLLRSAKEADFRWRCSTAAPLGLL